MKETTGADFKSATEQENKKLFIETYGCQMNVADSEVIASIMQKNILNLKANPQTYFISYLL